jgi:hypothetical protein
MVPDISVSDQYVSEYSSRARRNATAQRRPTWSVAFLALGMLLRQLQRLLQAPGLVRADFVLMEFQQFIAREKRVIQ